MKLRTILSICILIISVSSVGQWLTFNTGSSIFWWTVYAIILWIFLLGKKYYYPDDAKLPIPISIFLIWVVLCSIRGMFIADNYWEWKNLVVTTMVFLLPLSIYTYSKPEIFSSTFNFWFKFAPALFFVLLPFMMAEAIGRFLIPFSFLLIFFPSFTFRKKIYILFFVSLVFILGTMGARGNIVKFAIPFLLSFLYYFRKVLSIKAWYFFNSFLLLLPLVFFSLAVSGQFNVLNINNYLKITYEVQESVGDNIKTNILTDNRTGLYTEVVSSALKNNYLIQGRTFARGYDSRTFGRDLAYVLGTGKLERFSCEVSILNVFTWMGMIGVVLYFLIFVTASFNAIKRSKNIFMKILALYVSFRWTFAWLEDYNRFDLNYLLPWLVIAICFSPLFLNMTDEEFCIWINRLIPFDKKNVSTFLNSNELQES